MHTMTPEMEATYAEATFTAAHRGGGLAHRSCSLHGFINTWRTWELVLPALEARHDVLAPTLAGHAGRPQIAGQNGS